MSKEKLTKQHWSKIIRAALKEFATMATEERGSIDDAAAATFLSRASIEKMKSNGSGSVESWIKLAAYKANLSTEDVFKLFDHVSVLLENLRSEDQLDELYIRLRDTYSAQELAAWLQLLLAKRQVEEFVGVNLEAKMEASPKSESKGRKSPMPKSGPKRRTLKAAQPRVKKR